ncbi:hypothetical protein [Novilysobacter erysipheiresistens]|uniref:Uncharacterized protein n=1 Tax=Novilysobacter erysipheiresistens TaxID=1749332 RepID=A0ABU7Z1K9_9GAMM
MNPHDHDFDLEARRLHAQALQHLSPQVRGRLRDARRASASPESSRHRFGWLLAGGAVAVTAALVLALQLRPAAPEPAPALAAAPGPAERASQRAELDRELDDMLVALDENPDLYLWLAANDDALPPPSEY